MRRVAVLMSVDNSEARTNHAAFVQSLRQLGWVDGQNVRIETRWADGTASLIRKNATGLALAPDAVVVSGNDSMGALLQATRTVPIVFAQVADPVGSGFVKTMARPGGNATGFVQFDYSLSVKWPELLKQIAPNVTRAAFFVTPTYQPGLDNSPLSKPWHHHSDWKSVRLNELDAGNIEREVMDFAASPSGGLIVTASALSITHLELICRQCITCVTTSTEAA
jgi:putative ABC transport system substrate-binding protein